MRVTCGACGRDMRTAESCEQQPGALPCGLERRSRQLECAPAAGCHDCGVRTGGFHHKFCVVEECATCGGQAVGGCACTMGRVH
jgi:hypothetical protein